MLSILCIQDMGAYNHRPRRIPTAGDYLIPFGKHKGRSLREVFEENPGYIDWLASQEWLYKATASIVHAYISQEHVKAEIDRIYNDEDYRCGGKLSTYNVFNPSEQTAKRFSLGKPSYLPIQRTFNFVPLPASVVIPPSTYDDADYKYRYRSPGPQEPPRDWDPSKQLPIDLDKRPPRMITVPSLFDIRNAEETTAYEAALQDEPPTRSLTAGDAWRLAAQIASEASLASSREQVPSALLPQAKELKNLFVNQVLQPVRSLYQALPKEPPPQRSIDHNALQDRFQELARTKPHLKNIVRIKSYQMFDPCI